MKSNLATSIVVAPTAAPVDYAPPMMDSMADLHLDDEVSNAEVPMSPPGGRDLTPLVQPDGGQNYGGFPVIRPISNSEEVKRHDMSFNRVLFNRMRDGHGNCWQI